MAFIKVQKVQYAENGIITSGSAAIVETQYDPTDKYHSKHTVRERLGKVLWLAADKKSGIFESPIRGTVEYNASTDTFRSVPSGDPRLKQRNTSAAEPQIHLVFGDVFFLLTSMASTGFPDTLREAFSDRSLRERLLCHLLHDIARDGDRISCDNFHRKSVTSLLFPDIPASSLKKDTAFFSSLEQDPARAATFQPYLSKLQLDSNRCKGIYGTILSIAKALIERSLQADGPSLSEILGKTSSVMCVRSSNGQILVETPNAQIKQMLDVLGMKFPSHLDPVSFVRSF